MTVNSIKERNFKIKTLIKKFSFPTAVLSLILLSALRSDQIRDYAIYGMRLCYANIIPTLFPFMIFSDILLCTVGESRIFKSGILLPLLMGVLCGFPLGALCVKSLYVSGKITKEKAEILLPVCSVPSLAFIISGVGAGMLNNTRLGFLLWTCVVLSSLATYALFCKNNEKLQKTNENKRQSFDFSESVKNAGYAMLSICSFIVFFSVINGLICSIIKNEFSSCIISSVLEIGNACFNITSLEAPSIFKLALLCFALSFSGISVFMQIVSVTKDCELSYRKFLPIKLFQAVVSILILLFCICISRMLFVG